MLLWKTQVSYWGLQTEVQTAKHGLVFTPCLALARSSWINTSGQRHLSWICSKFRGEQQGSLQGTACQKTLKEIELFRIKRRLKGSTIIIFKYKRMQKNPPQQNNNNKNRKKLFLSSVKRILGDGFATVVI